MFQFDVHATIDTDEGEVTIPTERIQAEDITAAVAEYVQRHDDLAAVIKATPEKAHVRAEMVT